MLHNGASRPWKKVLAAVALVSVISLWLLTRGPPAGHMVSQHIKLNTGSLIPSVGLGVFLATPGREAYNAVASALRIGYRQSLCLSPTGYL